MSSNISEGNRFQDENICTGLLPVNPDYNFLRHVGWQETNACISQLFSKENIAMVSRKVSELTRGVDPQNRKIIVSNEVIGAALDGVYTGYVPPVGDIHSRYIVPNDEQENRVAALTDQAIEVIVSNIRNEFGMRENNEKLTAWVQVLGDFNAHGLRSFAPIKVQKKRPSTMQFNMNY